MIDKPESRTRTVQDMFDFIPTTWNDAQIAVFFNGSERDVKRISLCTNSQGRRVVIFHEDDYSAHLSK